MRQPQFGPTRVSFTDDVMIRHMWPVRHSSSFARHAIRNAIERRQAERDELWLSHMSPYQRPINEEKIDEYQRRLDEIFGKK